MKQFLKDLGIDMVGYYSSAGYYIVDIEDSNEFAKIYSLLDKSDLVEEDEDMTMVTAGITTVTYSSEEFTVTIHGNLVDDTYQLIVKEN